MAANVIKQLLVGIGVDYDKKGEHEAVTGIDRVSKKALQLGTVVAGAFGAKALTKGFADSRDALGKFSETLGVTADDVQSLGNAVEREGGSLDSYMSQLEGIEQLRAGLLVGDAEFISIAGKAGIDTTELIAATDATDAYLSLANQFQTMTQQQRLNAASALGLDDASIRLLSRGRQGVEDIIEAQRQMRPVTESMTSTARDFNIQLHDMGQNIGGVTDQISDRLLPEINKITQGINAWFKENDALIDQNLDAVLDPLAENFTAVATAGTLLATSGTLKTFAGLAKYIPIAGSGLAGMAASLGTIASLGAAGAAGVVIGGIIEPYIDEDIKEDIGRTTARVFAAFGDKDAQMALESERQALNEQGLEQPGIPVWDWDEKDVKNNLGFDLPEWLFKPINTLGDEQPVNNVELPPSWTQEDVPLGTLPRVTPDEEVPVSNVKPFDEMYPVTVNVLPTQSKLSPFDDMGVNVLPTQSKLSPYDAMGVDVLPSQGELSPFDDMGVDVSPERDGITPFDAMSVQVEPSQGELSPYDTMGVQVDPSQGELSPYEPVSAEYVPQPVDVSQRRIESQTPQVPPVQQQRNDRPIRVEATLNLEGRIIDQRIIDVTERQNQIAIDDLSSSVRG